MVSRRRIVQLGAVTGGALLVPSGIASMKSRAEAAPPPGPHQHHTHGGTPVASGTAADAPPFSLPLPVPAVLAPSTSTSDTDYYRLTMRPSTAEILPGLRTPVLTYGGAFIGPTIKARTGRRVVLRAYNRLADPATVHLHGGHVPARSDGHPMDLIDPAGSKEYVYPNRQGGATLWYHDHAHHTEAEHVYRGLAGFYLLTDPAERELKLPSGAYDIPLMLRDANLAADGTLVYQPHDFDGRRTVLVNGRPQPYLPVAARKYRFRLLNASNLRAFYLRLGTGEPMTQIGSDGGLLEAPVPAENVFMMPAERVELVIDFSKYPVGTKLILENQIGDADADRQILRFDVVRTCDDPSRVPERLRTLPAMPAPTFTRDISVGDGTIDGKLFDHERVDATIKRGTTEIWRITNDSGGFHNLHLHLVQFRVLDRNGLPVTPAESGLKDTVTTIPGETVRIQATFGDFVGRYLYHCHLLDHSADGMMAQMEIVP